MAVTTPPNLNSLFQSFFTQLKGDASGVVKGIMNQLGASWTDNPTPENVTTSSLLAEAQLILSGPTLEKEGIAQAGALLSQVSTLLP